ASLAAEFGDESRRPIADDEFCFHNNSTRGRCCQHRRICLQSCRLRRRRPAPRTRADAGSIGHETCRLARGHVGIITCIRSPALPSCPNPCKDITVRPRRRMSWHAFCEAVEEAVASIPEPFQRYLENVAVDV